MEQLQLKEVLVNGTVTLHILSYKRNAPNIKLNHKFIFTLKYSVSICAIYEYDKISE